MRARIEALSNGPHGIARVDGKVHFVRNVAPGDVVEIEVREDRGSFAYAEVVRRLETGPAYRPPPCEYLPRCGGCPWQQIVYAAQTAAKEDNVRQALRRIGGLENPPVLPIRTAEEELHYRRRLSLRVENGRIGYFEAATHELVPIDHCLLAAPALEGAVAMAQGWVQTLGTRVKRLEIAATGDTDRVAIAAQAEGAFAGPDDVATRTFLRDTPRVTGATLFGRGWRHVWGDLRIRVPLPGDDSLEIEAGQFAQVTDAGNLALIEEVLSFASPTRDDVVADLFAGAGNFSVALSRRAANVVAVERNPAAGRDLRATVARLGLGNVTSVVDDVAAVLGRWVQEETHVDIVVLDPPRSGAAEAMPALRLLAPRRIVYVSCNPATLGRDLRMLSESYAPERIQPIDFFPQTPHVECVALLVPRAGAARTPPPGARAV